MPALGGSSSSRVLLCACRPPAKTKATKEDLGTRCHVAAHQGHTLLHVQLAWTPAQCPTAPRGPGAALPPCPSCHTPGSMLVQPSWPVHKGRDRLTRPAQSRLAHFWLKVTLQVQPTPPPFRSGSAGLCQPPAGLWEPGWAGVMAHSCGGALPSQAQLRSQWGSFSSQPPAALSHARHSCRDNYHKLPPRTRRLPHLRGATSASRPCCVQW